MSQMFIIRSLGSPKLLTFKKNEITKYIKTMICSLHKSMKLLTLLMFINANVRVFQSSNS